MKAGYNTFGVPDPARWLRVVHPCFKGLGSFPGVCLLINVGLGSGVWLLGTVRVHLRVSESCSGTSKRRGC